MKKKVFCLLLIFLLPLCLLFVGCSNETCDDNLSESEGQNPLEQVEFIEIGYYHDSEYYYTIVVNKATRVMYIHYVRGGQMTVLLNPDGTPMIYQGELD